MSRSYKKNLIGWICGCSRQVIKKYKQITTRQYRRTHKQMLKINDIEEIYNESKHRYFDDSPGDCKVIYGRKNPSSKKVLKLKPNNEDYCIRILSRK